jgi:diguanylate cyclase (GGDEF)-like protein/PAS domain S-box-containing protein
VALNVLSQREVTSNQVLKMLTANASLTEVLKKIVENVQLNDDQAYCTILLFEHNGKQLRVGADPDALNLGKNIQNQIDLNASFPVCAPTLQSGKQTIVKNIHSNPPCARCHYIASKTGLVSCNSEPIISSTGKMIGVFSIFHRVPHEPTHHDITLINQLAHLSGIAVEFIQSKQLLQHQLDLLAKVSAQIPGIIFQFRLFPDGRSCFPFISQAVRTMYGLAPEDLRNDATPFFGYRHPEDAARLEESVRESARSLSRWHIEYRLIIPGQGIRWRMGDAMPEKLDDGSIIWHGFITDITERKHAEERIQRMARYDALTDLPNRALLSDRLLQAFSNAKREHTNFALMFIDMDNFKPINDTLGHAIGDKLLARCALRMHQCVRESDTLARIGGDEFVVLLPNAESEHHAKIVAEKIRQSIESPFEIEDYTLNITISIGIAMYPDHGENELELSKNADRAMYFAKQHGRNTVKVYNDNIQESVKEV